jgi:hypothetical protein
MCCEQSKKKVAKMRVKIGEIFSLNIFAIEDARRFLLKQRRRTVG